METVQNCIDALVDIITQEMSRDETFLEPALIHIWEIKETLKKLVLISEPIGSSPDLLQKLESAEVFLEYALNQYGNNAPEYLISLNEVVISLGLIRNS